MCVTKTTILDIIYDKKAFEIFKNVGALDPEKSRFLITELKITRKQYYSNMPKLVDAGLVRKQNGKYLLTEFGNAIYYAYIDFEKIIEKVLANYWRPQAIDALDSREQREYIITSLIDDQEIKNLLMRKLMFILEKQDEAPSLEDISYFPKSTPPLTSSPC